MSTPVMILGESGTGKSTSLRNLNPKDVLLIQAVKKPLPFKANGWTVITKENQDGSIFCTDQSNVIVAAMERTKKPIIVIDDFQYILANEFMRRVTDKEVGNQAFAKYNEIARSAWDILMAAASLPDYKRVYILAHTQTDDFGKTKVKTIGKLLDEKITPEGLLTIVMRSLVINERYVFTTKNSGNDTVKTPLGLFDDLHIDNDLKVVDDAIVEYYQLKQAA
jgi:hypothetical protein